MAFLNFLPFFIGGVGILLLGLVLYFILHPRQGGDLSQVRRTYFYLMSFLSLVVLFWGAADLLRVLLENWWGATAFYYRPQDDFTRQISLRLSVILVTLPIYAFHWFQANPREPETVDLQGRKIYIVLVLGLSTLIVLAFGIWFVYQLINWILGVSTISLVSFALPIPYTVLGLFVWIWHFWLWRKIHTTS